MPVTGSGEQQLALCCGAAPTGTLRIANMGVGLLPRVQLDMSMEVRQADKPSASTGLPLHIESQYV
jgi:hypothetical protein